MCIPVIAPAGWKFSLRWIWKQGDYTVLKLHGMNGDLKSDKVLSLCETKAGGRLGPCPKGNHSPQKVWLHADYSFVSLSINAGTVLLGTPKYFNGGD